MPLRTPARLVVTGPEIVEHADTLGITAQLVLDAPGASVEPPDSLVVRIHDLSRLGGDADATVAGVVAAGLTPLVPALALAASAYGADLVLDGPVCQTSVAGARTATELAARWFGSAPVDIDSATGIGEASLAPGHGLLFSRGLDSLATLCVMRRSQAGPTHLVGMDWVDDPYAGAPQADVWHSSAAAAAEIGLPLVRVSTNARALLDPLVSWSQAHVPVLAGGSLALGGIISAIGVSSTFPRDHTVPYPSHPELDVLWSSAAVRVEHRSDVPGSRVDKAAVVAADPWASRWLKVCWQRAGDGNCGHCRKCLMTMSALWLVGADSVVASAFDGDLDPEAICACAGSHPMVAPYNFIDVANCLRAVAAGQPPAQPVVVGARPSERRRAGALAAAWDVVIAAGRVS